jgi:hypothetical protein
MYNLKVKISNVFVFFGVVQSEFNNRNFTPVYKNKKAPSYEGTEKVPINKRA